MLRMSVRPVTPIWDSSSEITAVRYLTAPTSTEVGVSSVLVAWWLVLGVAANPQPPFAFSAKQMSSLMLNPNVAKETSIAFSTEQECVRVAAKDSSLMLKQIASLSSQVVSIIKEFVFLAVHLSALLMELAGFSVVFSTPKMDALPVILDSLSLATSVDCLIAKQSHQISNASFASQGTRLTKMETASLWILTARSGTTKTFVSDAKKATKLDRMDNALLLEWGATTSTEDVPHVVLLLSMFPQLRPVKSMGVWLILLVAVKNAVMDTLCSIIPANYPTV